jgi:hypothetical protein
MYADAPIIGFCDIFWCFCKKSSIKFEARCVLKVPTQQGGGGGGKK